MGYRRHINQAAVGNGGVFVDFQGVMTNATVYLGGNQIAQHQGGYRPWTVDLTPQLASGDNVLAVVVDARWLDVPPDGNANGAPSVDYLQPGGLYRDAAGAAFYRSQRDPTPGAVILPVFFWDFGPGSPSGGPGSGSMIATNCDRLEIYVADHHYVTGTPDTQRYPNLSHPPVTVNLSADGSASPELRIDGHLGSQLVESLLVSSDTTRDRLVLTLEDASIAGDGNDMTRFTFRALDAYGNQRPYVTGDVTVSLAGPATLIAESPFPFAPFGGVGGGFIRSQPNTSGTATVTVTHDTLESSSATLTIASASEPTFAAAPPTGTGPPQTAQPPASTSQRGTPRPIPPPALAPSRRARRRPRSRRRSSPYSPRRVRRRESPSCWRTPATHSTSTRHRRASW